MTFDGTFIKKKYLPKYPHVHVCYAADELMVA